MYNSERSPDLDPFQNPVVWSPIAEFVRVYKFTKHENPIYDKSGDASKYKIPF